MPQRPDDVVEVASCTTEWQAESLAAALRGQGIGAEVMGGLSSGFRAEAPAKARIVVLRAQQAQAKAVIAGLRVQSESIDWDGVDVGRPEAAPNGDEATAGGLKTLAMIAGAVVAGALLLGLLLSIKNR